jgi:hypothetical protein
MMKLDNICNTLLSICEDSSIKLIKDEINNPFELIIPKLILLLHNKYDNICNYAVESYNLSYLHI